MVTSGIEHRGLLKVAKGAKTIVGRSTSNEHANPLANEPFFGYARVLYGFIGALKQKPLLGIFGVLVKPHTNNKVE
jgi:hypothetical protein